MKYDKILKAFLVLILSFLVFYFSFVGIAFNGSFYKKKFAEYNVYANIPEALSLHGNVIDFIKGKNVALSNEFNQREKDHLVDVRILIKKFRIAAYFSLIILLASAIFICKRFGFEKLLKYLGQILLASGIFILSLSSLIFIFLYFNFDNSFESFHRAFFNAGTYQFDPSYEIIVNLYPEKIFMDIGLRISIAVILLASAMAARGIIAGSKVKKENG